MGHRDRNLQVGVDVKGRDPTFAPFVGISFNRFDDRSLTYYGDEVVSSVSQTAVHRYVSFGLRFQFSG